jgi:hypothetical protein
VSALGDKVGVSPASSADVGIYPRPESSSETVTGTDSGTESFSGGEPSRSQVPSAVSCSSVNPASNRFGFRIWVFRGVLLLLLLSLLLWGSFNFLIPSLPLRPSLVQLF